MQINRATYVLPSFPLLVKHMLEEKIRANFLPGTSHRMMITETLFEDLTRKRIW